MPRKSARKVANARLLTELSIDRLYPEPKSNFLPFGSPKSPKANKKHKKMLKSQIFGVRVGVGGSGPYFSFLKEASLVKYFLGL